MPSLLLVASSLKCLSRELLHPCTGGGTLLGSPGAPGAPPATGRVVGGGQSIPVCP